MAIDRVKEAALIAAYKGGDSAAGAALLKMHNGAIYALAKRHAGQLEIDDAFQEAKMGFLKGVRRYENGHGANLLTYATQWTHHGISRSRQDTANIIRVPAHEQDRKRAGKCHEATLAAMRQPISFSAPIRQGAEMTLEDVLRAPDDHPADYEAHETEANAKAAIKRGMSFLSARERIVIARRFLDDEPQTLKEVGDAMGLSRERARQIQARAMQKMHEHLGASFDDALEGEVSGRRPTKAAAVPRALPLPPEVPPGPALPPATPTEPETLTEPEPEPAAPVAAPTPEVPAPDPMDSLPRRFGNHTVDRLRALVAKRGAVSAREAEVALGLSKAGAQRALQRSGLARSPGSGGFKPAIYALTPEAALAEWRARPRARNPPRMLARAPREPTFVTGTQRDRAARLIDLDGSIEPKQPARELGISTPAARKVLMRAGFACFGGGGPGHGTRYARTVEKARAGYLATYGETNSQGTPLPSAEEAITTGALIVVNPHPKPQKKPRKMTATTVLTEDLLTLAERTLAERDAAIQALDDEEARLQDRISLIRLARERLLPSAAHPDPIPTKRA